jgi:hypothetical protein
MTRLASLSIFCAASALLGAPFAARAESGFSFSDVAGDHLDVRLNGKALLRWQYAFDASTPERLHDTYKPYLHVLDSEGKELITKGPGGEFTHHRGWFLGWNKITTSTGTVDRWHMKGGNIVQQKVVSQKAGPDSATFTVLLNWQGATEAPILSEERTFTILPAPAPAYVLVEMKSELTALAGETKLDGDPEHAGLQFRPAANIERLETSYLFPRADADPKKDRDYPWVAQQMTVSGKKYTVAFLNHPANPTDTPFSAYRDYGRFGAFFRTTIPDGGKLTIKGRLVIAEGKLTPEFIQKQANAFTGKSDPTPSVTERPADKPAPKKEAKKEEAPAK